MPKAKRTWFEPQEIKAWKNVSFTGEQKYLERDRDMFLFKICTGYYYKDLPIFMKDQLLVDEGTTRFVLTGDRSIFFTKMSWFLGC